MMYDREHNSYPFTFPENENQWEYSNIPIPSFSSFIEQKLQDGDISNILNYVVEECAKTIICTVGDNFRDKSAYSSFCRKFYFKYPSIGDPSLRKPWVSESLFPKFLDYYY